VKVVAVGIGVKVGAYVSVGNELKTKGGSDAAGAMAVAEGVIWVERIEGEHP